MTSFRFKLDGIEITKSEEKIINYIYQNISIIPVLSIGELSKELDMSVATLSRFVRHIGYENYKELKTAIIEYERIATPAGKLQSALSETDIMTPSRLLMRQESYLIKTREHLTDSEINNAVQAILKARKVYFFGKGASFGLAQLFAFRLSRFQKSAVILKSGGSELFEDLIHIQRNDLVIIFGFQKMPVEAKVLLEHKKETGYNTILFTDKLYLDPEIQGDINLYVYRGEDNEYHSMTVPTAVIDTIVLLTSKALKNKSIQSLSDLYLLKEKYSSKIPCY